MEIFNSLLKVLDHPLNRNSKVKTFFRILWWKANQLFFRMPSIRSLTPSVRCVCYPDSSNGGLIVYTTLPDFAEMNYLLKNLKTQDCFLDIGANIGAYSLLASSVIKKGIIYAFEPFPQSAARIRENIAINGIENIRIEEKIVSDITGFESFDTEKESEVNHISYNKNNGNSLRYPSITLDDFIKGNRIKSVELMKIDVEGAEMKILKGAQNSIEKGRINKIIIELNRNNQKFGVNNRHIAEWLLGKGFKISSFSGNGRLEKIQPDEIDNEGIVNILAVRQNGKQQ